MRTSMDLRVHAWDIRVYPWIYAYMHGWMDYLILCPILQYFSHIRSNRLNVMKHSLGLGGILPPARFESETPWS